MDIFSLYDSHLLTLSLGFSSLVLWKVYRNASAYKWIISLVLILLVVELFNDKGLLLDNLLHFGVDLILISAMSVIATLAESKFVRLIMLIVGLISLPQIHLIVNSKISEKVKSENSSLMKNGEFLIKVDNASDIKFIESEYSDIISSLKPAFDLKNPGATELDNYYILDVVDQLSHEKILNSLSGLKWVNWVEYNQKITIPLELPKSVDIFNRSTSDPMIDQQWANDIYKFKNLHNQIDKTKTYASNPAIVAIIDSGVDSQHEDLRDNYHSFGLDGDVDAAYHGTHCAGIAAAVSNNRIGIASLIPNTEMVKVTGVQVINRFGFGFQSTIIEGIIDAVDAGADVISLSLGSFTSEEKELAYEEAVKYATDQGVIVIAAAGNSKLNAKDYSPANTKGIICVGSIDRYLNKSDFSNYLTDIEMGIYAPGSEIISTLPNNKYGVHSGTSMSAPFVAGLAGLAKFFNPSLSSKEFHHLMKKSAVKKNGILIVDPSSFFKMLLNDK